MKLSVQNKKIIGSLMSTFLTIMISLVFINSNVYAVNPTQPLPNYPGSDAWEMTFEENFDGTSLDPAKWTIRDSDQYVYHDKSFVTVSDGKLNLKIDKDPVTGRVMLGRIDTHIYEEAQSPSKWSQQYGFFECRAEVPPTDQTYFAFWFMAPGVEYIDGTGRDGCEIDVTETAVSGDNTISTLHWDGYGASHKSANSGSQSAPGIHSGYHTYGLEWDPDTLKFYYDGKLTWTYSGIAVPWVKEYIILSSGTGTWVAGNINNASLPYYAHVDYVRAWQKEAKVINGNFETGAISPWTTTNSAGITNTGAYTGNFAGYVMPNGTIEQVITGLTPNTTYEYTADVKLENSGNSALIGVDNFGGSEVVKGITSTNYTQNKIKFTTGQSNTSARIFLHKPAGSGKALIDEVTVAPQTNYVPNGTFEKGDKSPWSSYNNSGVVNTDVYSGNYSGYVDTASSLEQVITGLKPNTTYVYNAYVKVQNSGDSVNIGVKDFGGTEVITTVNSTTYQNSSVTFTTGAANTTAKIYLYKAWNTGAGKAFIDEVKLREISNATNFIVNGNLETGVKTPWTSYNASGIVNANAYAGTYAGYVDPASSFEQVITGLTPNTTYIYSAYVKVQNIGETVNIGATFFGGTETYIPVSSTTYQKYYVIFTTGASNTTAKIYLWKPVGSGKAYIDNAVVTK